MMCEDWALYHELYIYVFMYFDMFCIQWYHLEKKDLWNKVYMNMNMTNKDIIENTASKSSSIVGRESFCHRHVFS
jgi:hypothetical protein